MSGQASGAHGKPGAGSAGHGAPAGFSAWEYFHLLIVVLIWGTNFVVMKLGLETMTPMVMGALRFACAALPILFFLRPPAVPWFLVLAYGLVQATGQFGFLFTALHLGMPAGLASLVMQTQAFFTLLLAVALLREPVRGRQWLGLAIATLGLGIIASSVGDGPLAMTMIGLLLTLCSAFMWAVGNLLVRVASQRAPGYDPLALVVWSSPATVPVFLLLGTALDGPQATWAALLSIDGRVLLMGLFLGLGATTLAYTLWTKLLLRHSASKVAPYSLLVPPVGLISAAWAFGEYLLPSQWLGVAVVLLGLLVNQWTRRRRA